METAEIQQEKIKHLAKLEYEDMLRKCGHKSWKSASERLRQVKRSGTAEERDLEKLASLYAEYKGRAVSAVTNKPRNECLIELNVSLTQRIDKYRRMRKVETGKNMQRQEATVELLKSALDKFEPPTAFEETVRSMISRIERLEKLLK